MMYTRKGVRGGGGGGPQAVDLESCHLFTDSIVSKQ